MRGARVAFVLAGLVVAASATAAEQPVRVSLTASPLGAVTIGQAVKLTARAAIPAGARLVIGAGRTQIAACRRSPCIGSYSAPSPGTIGFVASVRRGGAALGTSRTLTVRWTAAAAAASIEGGYAGRTTQNEPLRFVVDGDRTITDLEIAGLNEVCIYPDGSRVSRIGGNIGPLARSFPIAADGSFEITLSGPTVVGSVPSVSRILIGGRFRAGTAVGTVRDDVTASTEPKLSCTTGDQSWVAVKS